MLMSQMMWEVQQGKCTRVNAYQRNDGTPVANVDIAYAGGMKSCQISPGQVDRYAPFEGKMVTATGVVETQQMGRDEIDAYILEEMTHAPKSQK